MHFSWSVLNGVVIIGQQSSKKGLKMILKKKLVKKIVGHYILVNEQSVDLSILISKLLLETLK